MARGVGLLLVSFGACCMQLWIDIDPVALNNGSLKLQ